MDHNPHRRFVIASAVAGAVAIGIAGFAAASGGSSPRPEVDTTISVETTAEDPTSSVDDTVTSTSVDDTATSNSLDDATSSTIDDDNDADDDSTSSTIDDDNDADDDSTSSTIDDDNDADDDSGHGGSGHGGSGDD